MSLLSTVAVNSLTLRKRSVTIEKECKYHNLFLKKVNRRNATLLLTELVNPTRTKGQDSTAYLQALMPQLQDIDQETRNKVFGISGRVKSAGTPVKERGRTEERSGRKDTAVTDYHQEAHDPIRQNLFTQETQQTYVPNTARSATPEINHQPKISMAT